MSNDGGVLKAYVTDDLVFTPEEQEMFSQDKQVQPQVSVFQRLGKVNEPKERNIQVRKKKKWKMNKNRQQFRSFVWVREQNKVELADQVNVVSIGGEEDTQILNFLVLNLLDIKRLP